MEDEAVFRLSLHAKLGDHKNFMGFAGASETPKQEKGRAHPAWSPPWSLGTLAPEARASDEGK